MNIILGIGAGLIIGAVMLIFLIAAFNLVGQRQETRDYKDLIKDWRSRR